MRLLVIYLILVFRSAAAQVDLKPLLTEVLYSNQRDTVCLQYLTVKEFKNRLALLETSNLKKPYQAVNRYGYTGKYQLSKKYIAQYSKTTYERFLKSAWIQERTMNRLIAHYINSIYQRGWGKYIGKEINGVTVTLEGLLAGYHQHPVALKKWLESNGKTNLQDGNGCPVSVFIRKFEL